MIPYNKDEVVLIDRSSYFYSLVSKAEYIASLDDRYLCNRLDSDEGNPIFLITKQNLINLVLNIIEEEDKERQEDFEHED